MKRNYLIVLLIIISTQIFSQTPALHVTEEGNIAVGNWSAASKLHVWDGGILTDSYFGFYGGPVVIPTSGIFIGVLPLNGNFGIYHNGLPRVTIGSFGETSLLGIGTGTDQVNFPLEIRAERSGNPMVLLESTGTESSIYFSTDVSIPNTTSDWLVGCDGVYPGRFTIQTIGSGVGPSIFFDETGYNGFGVAEPQAVLDIIQYGLDLKDGIRFTNGSSQLNIYGRPGGEYHIDSNTFLVINRDGEFVRIGNELAPAHPLDMASGAHVTVGGVWTNASSRNLKENIRDLTIDEALIALSQLSPKKYYYKTESEEEYLGFIAEDVPDLVATKNRDSMSPMDIVALLTKIVQEQQKRIDILETKLNNTNK